MQLSPAKPAEHGGRLTTTAADQHGQSAVLVARQLARLASWCGISPGWLAALRTREEPPSSSQGPVGDCGAAMRPGGRGADGAAFYMQADGRLTEHALARGDAVVFCSEMVHNVQMLRAGVRESLVIELWTGPPTRVDRHR